MAHKRVNVHTVPEGGVYVYDYRRRLDYKRVEEGPAAAVALPPAREAKTPDPRAKAKRRA
ncbi:MAG: hypothetical protein ACYC1C_08510 [Chloroflexota bacterium]